MHYETYPLRLSLELELPVTNVGEAGTDRAVRLRLGPEHGVSCVRWLLYRSQIRIESGLGLHTWRCSTAAIRTAIS